MTRGIKIGHNHYQCKDPLSLPGYEYCVEPVEVPAEVPEAGLPAEAAVDEHVEAVDSEERRVTLAAGEDIDGWVAEKTREETIKSCSNSSCHTRRQPEAYVAYDVRRRQGLLHRLRHQKRRQERQERLDRRVRFGRRRRGGRRVQLHLERPK